MEPLNGYMTPEEETLPATEHDDSKEAFLRAYAAETLGLMTGTKVTSVITDGIGDITSDAKGSGARFNAGKTPYELLPLGIVFTELALKPKSAADVLTALGRWQAGENDALGDAFAYAIGDHSTLESLADAAMVFDYGRKKYAEWNWAKGMKWSAPLGCAIRHCVAILRGEDIDPESGLPHLGHVKCNLLMLLTFASTFPEGDDRPVKWI